MTEMEQAASEQAGEDGQRRAAQPVGAEPANVGDALDTNLGVVDAVFVVGQVVGDAGDLVGGMVAGAGEVLGPIGEALGPIGEVLGAVGDALSVLDGLGNSN
jgi:hypothetical protein